MLRGIFCDRNAPVQLKDDRDTPDTLLATIDSGKFAVRFTNSQVGIRMDKYAGALFYGTKGTLFVDRNGYEVIPSKFSAIVRSDIDQVQDMLASRRREVTGDAPPARERTPSPPLCEPVKVTGIKMDPAIQEVHVQNFLDCVKSRKKPAADVEVGHTSIIPCHLANISYKTGRRILWDAEREEIMGDAAVSKLLAKDYRPPWKV